MERHSTLSAAGIIAAHVNAPRASHRDERGLASLAPPTSSRAGAPSSAFAALHALPDAIRVHVGPWRLYPKIVLEDCAYCVGGRKRFLAGGRVIDEACAVCGGAGTVTVEA